MARLWQSLLRHSEAGRFRQAIAYSPHPICSFLAMELLQRILQASGVSLLLVNLLVGAVGNSIFAQYTPETPQHELRQHADIAVDLRDQLARTTDELTALKKQVAVHKAQLAAFQIPLDHDRGCDTGSSESTVRDKAQLVMAVLRSVADPTLVPLVITDALTPFLSDDMMLVLWNATARATASQSATAEHGAVERESVSVAESRQQQASKLAARVLQERVRLMLTQYGTLSAEEQIVVGARLADHSHSGRALKGVLQTLEEVYTSEQMRDKGSAFQQRHRSMFLSPMVRQGSVAARSIGYDAAASAAKLPMASRARALPRTMSPVGSPTTSVLSHGSVPDVLLAAPSDEQLVAATNKSELLLIEQLSRDQDEILSRCEAIFELLCRDPSEPLAAKSVVKGGVIAEEATEEEEEEEHDATADTPSVQTLAKQQLCELLCDFVDAPSSILDKLDKSEALRILRESTAACEADDANANANGTTAMMVRTILAWHKQNPSVLVAAINQCPEMLLSAIAHNNGILRFAITKFTPLVKRFLRLDLKTCEHLDVLAHKNQGAQLLWGSSHATIGHAPAPSSSPSSLSSSSSSSPSPAASVSKAASASRDNTTVVDAGDAQAPLLSVNDVLDEIMSRRTSILSLLANTASPARGAALTPEEVHLLQWFSAHTSDLATLALKRPELLKPLFVEMHAQGEAGPLYKVLLQLNTTKGVQNYFHRASMATLERIAQEDPAEVTRLLREILLDPPNRELVHALRTSPYLATCLSEFHPTVIQDVIASDMDTWKQFFVETMAGNDALLKECLATRTEDLEGGDTLVQLFSAVVSAATTGLNLAALDFGASATDVAMAREREVASRRKSAQALYLRGGGGSVFRCIVSQLVATVGYHPHEFRTAATARAAATTSTTSSSSTTTHSGVAAAQQQHRASAATLRATAVSRIHTKKPHRGSSTLERSSKKRPQSSITKKDDIAVYDQSVASSSSPEASLRGLGVYYYHHQQQQPSHFDAHVPLMWQSFVHAFERHQLQHSVDAELRVPTLSRAHTKTLILDLWIEFLKVDTLQLDNACLWTMAPFVCDCLVTRYDSPLVVGAWLHALTEALVLFHDDPRVAFFAAACGLRLETTHSVTRTDFDGYDTFLYYAHALGHLLFGQMKVFRTECRLEETMDGSCRVPKRFVTTTAARLFDHRLLSGNEIDELMTRLEALPVAVAVDAETVEMVELDDAMQVFLDQWRLVNSHVDERYAAAFRLCDPSDSGAIGLDQFTKIVMSVTQQRISARECLLIYCDVGEELLDLETLLRVTRVYHLRLFNAHLPEIPLDDDDVQALKLSTGRSNVFSVTREVEDLQRFWRGLRGQVRLHVDASHQSKATKTQLKKQSALVEKLLSEIQSHVVQPTTTTSDGAAEPPAMTLRLRSLSSLQKPPLGAAVPPLLLKAWHELRVCAKMLNAATLTQHYLSRLYIQSCIVGWIRQTRKRRARLMAETTVAHHEDSELSTG